MVEDDDQRALPWSGPTASAREAEGVEVLADEATRIPEEPFEPERRALRQSDGLLPTSHERALFLPPPQGGREKRRPRLPRGGRRKTGALPHPDRAYPPRSIPT